MYQEDFEKLAPEDVEQSLKQLGPVLEGCEFNPEHTVILALDLSFYPGMTFYEIADVNVQPPLKRYVVHGQKETVVLDFTNAPIYALNEALPIKLSKKNIESYVRFFFSYVRGKKGRFIICENVDDIPWRDEPPPAARKAMGKMMVPVALEKNR